eukprot:1161685-Pelagomonas_calceolata.AAC.10
MSAVAREASPIYGGSGSTQLQSLCCDVYSATAMHTAQDESMQLQERLATVMADLAASSGVTSRDTHPRTDQDPRRLLLRRGEKDPKGRFVTQEKCICNLGGLAANDMPLLPVVVWVMGVTCTHL